jgi:hypothetical protein
MTKATSSMLMCGRECFHECVILFMSMKGENNFNIEALKERNIEFPIVKVNV